MEAPRRARQSLPRLMGESPRYRGRPPPPCSQRFKLKRPVLIRGGGAGVSEPASHGAETLCGMSEFSHALFARQLPCETVVRAAVQKLLRFWTAPSLVALSPCLGDDPAAGAVGSAPNCH